MAETSHCQYPGCSADMSVYTITTMAEDNDTDEIGFVTTIQRMLAGGWQLLIDDRMPPRRALCGNVQWWRWPNGRMSFTGQDPIVTLDVHGGFEAAKQEGYRHIRELADYAHVRLFGSVE